MEHASAWSGPVAPSERIVAIDVLRGFAVLGILIMNIQSFSMIQAAYLNPTAYGDFTGIHRWVWTLSHLFADQKFLSIFSMLFGAGILLMTGRREAAGCSAVGLHYRRTFWLLLFGLAHGMLLWYGDILATYAVCALVAFLFRKVRPLPLSILGFLAFGVPLALWSFFGWSMPYWPPESLEQTTVIWRPDAVRIAGVLAAYRGSWLEQMPERLAGVVAHATFVFFTLIGWRAGGLMLIGMALYKWGVMAAQRTRRFYAILTAAGLGVGLPLIGLGILRNTATGWTFEYSMFLGSRFNYLGSFAVALGYIGAVMLVARSSGRLTRLLAPVGRMAFTNYLVQTLICTLVFYGHGLGLFGKVERGPQILIVLAVWVFQIWFSGFWLRRFRFGPAEWLWRSLSYVKRQPMRIVPRA